MVVEEDDVAGTVVVVAAVVGVFCVGGGRGAIGNRGCRGGG